MENEEGIFYNGIFYPNEDILRAFENLSQPDKEALMDLVDSEPEEAQIQFLLEKEAMPKVHRENTMGWLLYPGFIAQDILEEAGAI